MEVGWSELLVIAVVALVVIGPKDLPEMFRTLGRFTAKMRAMAREFSRAMEDAAKETGVKDVADDLRKATSARSMGLDAVKSAADKFEKWDPLKTARGSGPASPPAGGLVAPAAAAGLGSATASAAAESTTSVPGPNTADLALKRAEREAIAREAAERLRNTAPPAADAFEDAPATIIAPKVTTSPLDTPAAQPETPAVKKPAPRKSATAKAADAVAKPARKTAKAAEPGAEPATKPRKTAAKAADAAPKAAPKTAAKAKPAASRSAKKTKADEIGDQA